MQKASFLIEDGLWRSSPFPKIRTETYFVKYDVEASSTSKSVIRIGLWKWLCFLQIFNAIPSPSFSAAAELRTFTLTRWKDALCSNLTHPSFPQVCSIHPRPLTLSGSFEDQHRCGETMLGGSKGVCPPWSQDALWGPRRGGSEPLEGEGERWKGESVAVPPPRR